MDMPSDICKDLGLTGVLGVLILLSTVWKIRTITLGRVNTMFQNYSYPFQKNIYKQFAKWNPQFDNKYIVIQSINNSTVKSMQDNV